MMRSIRILLLMLLVAVIGRAQDTGEHVRLTNLPHIYINTFTGQAVTSKTAMVYSRLWYVDEQDQVSYYDSVLVRVRGNSTANLAKKPYKLKFSTKQKLLGKGYANAKKWTLLANHGDKTLLRNALTSLMGERAELPFNPAAKFVDLTMNGQYVGNYQLSDQVEVRSHRVDISEQDYPLTAASNISGGYLLEADGFRDFKTEHDVYNTGQSPTGFYSQSKNVPIHIHYPDDEEIESRQVSYIQNHINNFETRLFSQRFDDPLAGYRPMVDSMTLANWYICTEISANIDGFFSTYFYKQRDDIRLFWGPLWDYDIAYNNDNRTDRGGLSNTERQLMKDYGYGSTNGCRQWIQRMWQDPWFARLVNRRYHELIDGGMEAYLNHKIDSLTALLDASQQLNYKRWGINTRTLRERVLYSTYKQYVDDVRTFISRHISFLSTAFAALLPDAPEPEPEPKTPDFIADDSYYYSIANAGTSTRLDVDTQNNEACARAYDSMSESQQWRIVNLSNGFVFIVNRATGLALNDPSPAGATATTQTGANINVVNADSTDARQMWDLIAQSDGRYNIVSRWSEHAANLRGGNAADGTRILSYTSDDRNATSANRLWRIEKADAIVDNGIGQIEQDYALAYDPLTGRLHFGADDVAALGITANVYSQAGRRVATFRATDEFSMQSLPRGLYIVSWSYQGRRHSVKVMW